MTDGILVLNNLLMKFKPDKYGKKWYENTIKELAEEEDTLIDVEDKKGRNSKSGKRSNTQTDML